MIEVTGKITITIDIADGASVSEAIAFLSMLKDHEIPKEISVPVPPYAESGEPETRGKKTRQAVKKRAYHKKTVKEVAPEKKRRGRHPKVVQTTEKKLFPTTAGAIIDATIREELETVPKESVTRKPLKAMTPEEKKARQREYARAWYLKKHPGAKEHKHKLSAHQQKMEDNREADNARIDAIADQIKKDGKCDNEWTCPMKDVGNFVPDPKYVTRTQNPDKKYCTLWCAEQGIQHVGGELI